MAKERKAQQQDEARAKALPVHEIRLGRIKAAVWANVTEYGIRHSVTLSRIYKDGDTWKRSESFGREDLPLVAKVADLAHTWIYQQAQEGEARPF
jgi:hypothetical protein